MRRLYILVSVAVLTFLGSSQMTTATAEVVVEEMPVVIAGAQSYTAPAAAEAPAATRDSFSVTVFDLVEFPILSWETSDCFGCRDGSHNGTDFVPGGGTPIVSIAKGVVVQAGMNGCYGNSVTIAHTINGTYVESLYGHMGSSPSVYVGQVVDVGTYLGPVGTTGCSTGNHLHLEIRVNGGLVDPVPWLQANVNWPVG